MEEKNTRKGLAVIYRQEILQDITLFTSAPKALFSYCMGATSFFTVVEWIISQIHLVVKYYLSSEKYPSITDSSVPSTADV